jgi:hypothetical protein
MGLKGYRLWVMGQLDSACRAPSCTVDDRRYTHQLMTAGTPCNNQSDTRGCRPSTKGDYYRYLAEFKGGEARKNAAEETLLAYKVGGCHKLICMPDLSPTLSPTCTPDLSPTCRHLTCQACIEDSVSKLPLTLAPMR